MFDRKTLNVFFVIAMLVFFVGTVISNTAYAGLADTVKQYSEGNGKALADDADKIASNIVNFVRGIAVIAGVCLVIWAGIVFGGAHGDPNKILLAKKILGGFVICLICVFEAEKIVGVLMGFFGFSTSGTATNTQ
ncbi:MAG: TrbC/VirB2 family protein [Peptococcaceae bacterium]|nr:TrbC/VirB2 family protein [Peptococcaceae bacterium]